MIKTPFSDVVMNKVLDGDFQTKMEGVEYSTTPREVIQIKHMEHHYWYKELFSKVDCKISGEELLDNLKTQVSIFEGRKH